MPPDPSGWPWPLDGVQAWFESLWNQVWEAANYAASQVWNMLPGWIKSGLEFLGNLAQKAWDSVWAFFKDPVGTLSALAGQVWDMLPDWIRGPINFLAELAGTVWNALISFFQDPLGSLAGLGARVWEVLPDWIRGALDLLNTLAGTVWNSLVAFFKDPVGSLKAGWDAAVRTVTTAFDGAVAHFSAAVTQVLAGVAEALGSGFQAFFDWLVKHLTWLSTMIMGAVNAVVAAIRGAIMGLVTGFIDTITGAVTPGSPPQELEVALNVMVESVSTRTFEIVKEAYASPPTNPGALAASVKLVGTLLAAKTTAEAAAAAGDAAHPLKQIQLRSIVASLVESLGVGAIISAVTMMPVTVGLATPLRYYYNETFAPVIPDTGELTRLATERLIPVSEYHVNMRRQGLNDYWADLILQASWRVPGYLELQQMLWRRSITMDVLEGSLRAMGVREDFIAGYVALTEKIPGSGDLITMMIREVIDPAAFTENMLLQGWSTFWAECYYEMHWVLLPLGEVRRARHRDLINDAELSTFLRLHDYKPDPRPGIGTSDRDLAAALVWDLPGRIDARWMFRWGLTDVDGLEDLLVKGGLDPEYAPVVAAATAMNQFLREIRAQETNIKADLRDGLITEETARADLSELGYPEPFVEYHVQDALRDRERTYKKDLLDTYEDGYLKDLVTEEDLTAQAHEILVIPEVADLFVQRAYIRKYKKPKAS